MTSTTKRRRLNYNPSDPDIPLGPTNLQEMLMFPRQVWNSMMRDGPDSKARSAPFAYCMSLVHVVCLDISDLFVVHSDRLAENNFKIIVTDSVLTSGLITVAHCPRAQSRIT